MRSEKNGLLSLSFLQNKFETVSRICFYLLILFVSPQCEDRDSERVYQTNVWIAFVMGVLPGLINHCPPADFVVGKGIEYQISLQKDKTSWFRFSPNGNITPPEEKRDYFLTVTRDSSVLVSLRSWTSCKTFSSPSREEMTPYSATPTEVKFKIEFDSFQFSETNMYRLELNSDTQTTVKIIQN